MREPRKPQRPMVKVWDPLVRAGHWLLVVSICGAWLTRHAPGSWHEYLGYAALVVVGVRLLWGCIGSGHARFSAFVRGPRSTWRYAQQTLQGEEPRHLGHNPLGGWMIVALLCAVTLVGFTGWLYTTDRFWGVEWVEELHQWLSNVLFSLVATHIAGVAYASYRHRENLVGSMMHGTKRP